MKLISRMCLLLLFGLAAKQGDAQQVLRIAAIVNDEVISTIDLNARINLTLLGMGQDASDDLARQLLPQIVQQLIDEKLLLQEARTRKITIGDNDVDAAVRDIESANKMPVGNLASLLQRNHVPISALQDQLRARMAWQQLVLRRVRASYPISDEEVDEEINRIKANAGKPEYLVSDIFLALGPNGDEQIVQTQARQLAEHIKAGANFAALARQFSQNSAASTAGDLGWVQPGQLEAPLERALAILTPGQVSEPISTQTGVHLLLLREKRIVANPSAEKILLKLSQILLPPESNATERERIRASAKNCTDFNEMARAIGPGNGDMGNVLLQDLPDELRQAVIALPIGQATPPIRTAHGISLLMVCARTDDGSAINRDVVRNQLLMIRADSESRRYLRDLRAAANIDVRL